MFRSAWIGWGFVALSACANPGLRPGEGFVDVEGGRVWYRIAGSGNATPLILLHGGPGYPSYYLNSLEAVSVDRPVIFYDQLGAGRSDRPQDETLWRRDRFVAELAQIRGALGLDEVHIYGHSWGTMLATEYMATKPAGVMSLVLASPAINVQRWREDMERLIAAMPAETQKVIKDFEESGQTDAPEYEAAIGEFFALYVTLTDPWPEDMQLTVENYNPDLYNRMWGPSEFHPTGTLKDFNREDVLPTLDIPVLFTAGRNDEATPETTAYFQSLTPGAQMRIFENSAHLTMIDEPETYAQAIRDFLNEVDHLSDSPAGR